ncbi:MAG: magnesium/cobalt transporter CorA [Planctomycetes bacterium]|nr:magnesium/cobalt transporter CorA [Planctomycetota bacterium]
MRLPRRQIESPGEPPGIGEQARSVRGTPGLVSVLDYTAEKFEEKEAGSSSDCAQYRDSESITWINIDSVADPPQVAELSEVFGIHPLVQEDIISTGERPKSEDYEDYLYVRLNMLCHKQHDDELQVEQVSFILTGQTVISFQEEKGDVFDPVRERIRQQKGRIRAAGSDYLLYALVDRIVDGYFLVLERKAHRIEEMEEEVIEDANPRILQRIQSHKRDLIVLRKSIWPLREALNSLDRNECELISESTRVYFRDVYDHCVQLIETVESFRDMISGLMDLYMTSVSNRMNEVMKVLTIIATVFIPLTFVAGVYGMNFKNMPELDWSYGYPAVLILMALMAGLMVMYFKKKKWL